MQAYLAGLRALRSERELRTLDKLLALVCRLGCLLLLPIEVAWLPERPKVPIGALATADPLTGAVDA